MKPRQVLGKYFEVYGQLSPITPEAGKKRAPFSIIFLQIIWFTALFPYFVMSILFLRSITLEGASVGLIHYITPRWDKFTDSETWIDSATQVYILKCIPTIQQLLNIKSFILLIYSDFLCLFHWYWCFTSIGVL